jgi:hypothetical protein
MTPCASALRAATVSLEPLGKDVLGSSFDEVDAECALHHPAFFEVLDDEAAAWRQVPRRVAKRLDLLTLAGEVRNRVAQQVDEREPAVDSGCCEVADGGADVGAPGRVRRCATMASDRSMPCTRIPRWRSGSATRPVPMPNSSASPVAARVARNSTAGSSALGSNNSGQSASYRSAIHSSKRDSGM